MQQQLNQCGFGRAWACDAASPAPRMSTALHSVAARSLTVRRVSCRSWKTLCTTQIPLLKTSYNRHHGVKCKIINVHLHSKRKVLGAVLIALNLQCKP